MDPYLPTWLALHGAPLGAAVALLLGGVLVAGERRGRVRGAALVGAALPLLAWLGPGLWALCRGGALPSTYGWAPLARWAPWLGLLAVIGAGARRRSPRLTVRSALALPLAVYGTPALVAAMALIATGRLESDSGRAPTLLAAIGVLVGVWVVEWQRFAVRGALAVAFGLGTDGSLWMLGAVLAVGSAVGWALVARWAHVR